MKSEMKQVPISERAVMQRLNRKLKADGLIIKKSRPDSKTAQELGDYYVVDGNKNFIADKNLDLSDLERMGRKHEVLAKWETVTA